jgi:hypothetical protein
VASHRHFDAVVMAKDLLLVYWVSFGWKRAANSQGWHCLWQSLKEPQYLTLIAFLFHLDPLTYTIE